MKNVNSTTEAAELENAARNARRLLLLPRSNIHFYSGSPLCVPLPGQIGGSEIGHCKILRTTFAPIAGFKRLSLCHEDFLPRRILQAVFLINVTQNVESSSALRSILIPGYLFKTIYAKRYFRAYAERVNEN